MEKNAKPPKARGKVPTSSPKQHQVLLIEEDPKQIDLYADLLREIADSRVDVMSRIENSFSWIARSNYHLVVIDISGKDGQSRLGLGVLEQIKRISPTTSVILISDHASVEQAVSAIRSGAEDYFKKPLNVEAFQLAVKRGLDRKALFADDSSDASVFLNLLNSCQMISGSLEQDKIFAIIQSYLLRELKCGHTGFYTVEDGNPVQIQEGQVEDEGVAPDRAMEEVLGIALHASNCLAQMAESGEFYRFIERGQMTPGLFVFRFRCAGESDCFCVGLSPEKPRGLAEFEARLRLLKAQIELTGKNIEEYMGVKRLAYVDDVTGLYNTRYMNFILDREIAQSQSTNKSFAVLFIDADKFKSINDTHGHLVGSKLLNELGNHLKKFVRDRDTIFRYGGDEFVAILSPCDLVTAKSVAERIRQSVESHDFLRDEGLNLHFTISTGVALFPDHANSKKAIMDAADHAMFGAKKRSRNTVTIAELAPEEEPSKEPDKKRKDGTGG